MDSQGFQSRARAAGLIVSLLLLSSSGGCATVSHWAAGGGVLTLEERVSWQDCLDAISEPRPGGWPNLVGGTLFLVLDSPLWLFETEVIVLYLVLDTAIKLFKADYDMRLTKYWLCWWAVLLGSRRFTVTGAASRAGGARHAEPAAPGPGAPAFWRAGDWDPARGWGS